MGLIRELVAASIRRRRWVRVRGDSMVPTLHPGDLVLVNPGLAATQGALVVVRDPDAPHRELVKRVGSTADGSFAVRSDSPAGARDSRTFGSLDETGLAGVVTVVFTRAGRFRTL